MDWILQSVVKYLQKLHKLDVITLTVDVGQNDDFSEISDVSAELGAIKHVYVDAKKEFVRDYVLPTIKANALYQQKYPLATAIARPLIAKKAVETAKRFGEILYLMVLQLAKVTIKSGSI